MISAFLAEWLGALNIHGNGDQITSHAALFLLWAQINQIDFSLIQLLKHILLLKVALRGLQRDTIGMHTPNPAVF